MNTKRDCQSCKYYKDGYCENLELKPNYPNVGCDYFDKSCDFCSTIYPDADTQNIVFRKGKYSDVRIDSFITIDNEGKYHVTIDPGDPYELGYLANIKFCPYCGRKLAES